YLVALNRLRERPTRCTNLCATSGIPPYPSLRRSCLAGEKMITGSVNSKLEAILRITVRGTNGRRKRISAVIDTGYNGALTLPPELIVELGLPWCDAGSVMLGDGSTCECDIYAGTVVWNRRPTIIFVE